MMLYLRSRSAPLTLVALLGCTASLWALGLAIDNPQGRVLAALLITLAATTVLAPGLAGPDTDLDRTTAFAWPPRRAAHLLGAASIVVGFLTATSLAGQTMAATAYIARNVAGMAGLVGLGAVLFGAARAPLLPVLWTVLVLKYAPPMGVPPVGKAYKVMLTWMVQPSGVRPALVAAALLGGAGTLAYALFGSRR
jgi:hypothetical protein